MINVPQKLRIFNTQSAVGDALWGGGTAGGSAPGGSIESSQP